MNKKNFNNLLYTDEQINDELVDALIKAGAQEYIQNSTLEIPSEELSDVEFSDELDRKLLKYFDDLDKQQRNKNLVNFTTKAKNIAMRAAAALFVLVVLAVGFVATSEAAQIKLLNIYVEYTDIDTRFFFGSDRDPDTDNQGNSAITSTETVYSYIPFGFEFVHEDINPAVQTTRYEDIEGKYPVDNKVIGKVVSITDYGAFVELEQGVEGLVHISEMSWTQHIRHPSKVVSIGDEVEVMILNIDKDEQKISLGLKQVQADPWSDLDAKYPSGTRLMGTVRNLTNFGAFVEIEDGIDGLVHISDMSWTKRIRHPNEVVKKGQELEVVVLNIDKERRRISLGHKQTIENPWAELAVTYAVGNPANGKVSRLLERGVVVDLDGDVEGFVPASQLSIEEVEHPEDCFVEGDPLPLKVVEFDEEQKKIVLSVREYLRDAPEEEVTAFVEAHQPREGAAEAREAAAAGGGDDASEEGAPVAEASSDAEDSEAEKVEA